MDIILLVTIFLSPLLAIAAILTIRYVRPKLSSYWLAALTGGLVTWSGILVVRSFIPLYIPLSTWQPEFFFPLSPTLILDGFSWPIALALATIVVAILLADTISVTEFNSMSWIGILFLSFLGLLAIMAGNQITLLLSWAAIDLVELVIWMFRTEKDEMRERVIIAFSVKTAGIMLSLWGSGGLGILIIAAAMRLGVLPFYVPFLANASQRHSLGTMIRFTSPAAVIPLLARLSMVSGETDLRFLFWVFWLLGLFASIAWVMSKNELEGRPFWITACAVMSLAGVIQGQPAAILTWGMIMLFSGGAISLYRLRSAWLIFIPGLLLITLAGFPFTPGWYTMGLYDGPQRYNSWVYFLIHSILFTGFVKHIFRKAEHTPQENWSNYFYPWGLIIIPLVQFVTYYWKWDETLGLGTGYSLTQINSPLAYWGGGIVVLLFFLGLFCMKIFKRRLIGNRTKSVTQLLSYEWMYPISRSFYQIAEWLFNSLFGLLESEAGLLWTLLFLILIFAFFAGGGSGG